MNKEKPTNGADLAVGPTSDKRYYCQATPDIVKSDDNTEGEGHPHAHLAVTSDGAWFRVLYAEPPGIEALRPGFLVNGRLSVEADCEVVGEDAPTEGEWASAEAQLLAELDAEAALELRLEALRSPWAKVARLAGRYLRRSWNAADQHDAWKGTEPIRARHALVRNIAWCRAYVDASNLARELHAAGGVA